MYKYTRVECPVVRDPEGSSDPRREPVEGQFSFYILECSDGSLYCGSTTNLAQRVRTHNAGTGAVWTRERRPVQLVYFEFYNSLPLARQRELQVKGWSRVKKEKLLVGVWKKVDTSKTKTP